jgi:hypothetical protein
LYLTAGVTQFELPKKKTAKKQPAKKTAAKKTSGRRPRNA